jgi:hypothetical protein
MGNTPLAAGAYARSVSLFVLTTRRTIESPETINAFIDLLRGLLTVDPLQRWTAKQVRRSESGSTKRNPKRKLTRVNGTDRP